MGSRGRREDFVPLFGEGLTIDQEEFILTTDEYEEWKIGELGNEEFIKGVKERFRRQGVDSASAIDMGDWREEHSATVSWLLSERADEMRATKRFVADHLPRMLESREEVEAWIQEQTRADDAIASREREEALAEFGNGPEGEGILRRAYKSAERLGWHNEVEYVIEIAHLNLKSIVTTRCKTSGLRQLCALGEKLSSLGWTEAEARGYVLTGCLPQLQTVVASLKPPSTVYPLPHILMRIDPNATPQQVAEAYARVRVGVKARSRPFTKRQMHLARYTTPLPGSDEEWIVAFTEWNDKFGDAPSWRYRDLRAFKSSAAGVRKRLLAATSETNTLKDHLLREQVGSYTEMLREVIGPPKTRKII